MKSEKYNIISLAYLGDAVYELYIRKYLLEKGIYKVENLNKEAIKYVCAKGQANILDYLIEMNKLNDEEINVVKRGRNYKRSSHPKSTDIITYKKSTGFEALLGYHYINNNIVRLEELIKEVQNADIWKKCMQGETDIKR